MKVVIINAYGRSNRGDAVLLDECISDVLSVWPEADIGCVVFEGIESAIETHPKNYLVATNWEFHALWLASQTCDYMANDGCHSFTAPGF